MIPDDGELTATVQFELNGHTQAVRVDTNETLLGMLRSEFDCRGVRASCERGVCGACTVLIDDLPVAACSTFAFAVDGASVQTVEGLADDDGTPSPAQRGFTECGGFQCGYCTSGMLMLTTGLLRHTPEPDRATIREWISSNTCRCTGYETILESVECAARIAAADAPHNVPVQPKAEEHR
ncbi:(2Fe-2S)-binding protein [Gordonia sp. ABSL11-1]|jgi:aerobic carbon-monoxide dehydrogenase small subunit|uniref:(2Fe-2S)-binding protein n=1 Tax=Gordonia sp. ABSL11-1 TaxID=3053924 RepID=UPI002573A4EE|nr:(2Fe-2S)-binding protein [Gordonia sp. ABSL11-1]MDL9947176.1 (2Fe-2S)-binding protein [Gordonia sp. ABSL11-1]